jgi:hypothetical protein
MDHFIIEYGLAAIFLCALIENDITFVFTGWSSISGSSIRTLAGRLRLRWRADPLTLSGSARPREFLNPSGLSRLSPLGPPVRRDRRRVRTRGSFSSAALI